LKLPEQLVLFIDRSLGKQILASALRNAGHSVAVHDDYFPPDAPDNLWLSEVSPTKARVFTLTAGSIQAREMADIFILAMPKVQAFVARNSPPYIVTISRSGLLSKVYP
jgi:cytosine/adenosine deaminase-related metal-dependent hydrolase